MEGAGYDSPVAIDASTGSVSVDQVTARSPQSMDFYRYVREGGGGREGELGGYITNTQETTEREGRLSIDFEAHPLISPSIFSSSAMAKVAVNQLDMTDAQKAVFLSYTSYALAGLNASIELNCAWQASVGMNFNIAFPDGVSK